MAIQLYDPARPPIGRGSSRGAGRAVNMNFLYIISNSGMEQPFIERSPAASTRLFSPATFYVFIPHTHAAFFFFFLSGLWSFLSARQRAPTLDAQELTLRHDWIIWLQRCRCPGAFWQDGWKETRCVTDPFGSPGFRPGTHPDTSPPSAPASPLLLISPVYKQKSPQGKKTETSMFSSSSLFFFFFLFFFFYNFSQLQQLLFGILRLVCVLLNNPVEERKMLSSYSDILLWFGCLEANLINLELVSCHAAVAFLLNCLLALTCRQDLICLLWDLNGNVLLAAAFIGWTVAHTCALWRPPVEKPGVSRLQLCLFCAANGHQKWWPLFLHVCPCIMLHSCVFHVCTQARCHSTLTWLVLIFPW